VSTYRRTIAAEIVLVVLLALAILVSVSGTGANPVTLTSGLAVANNAESTALYCTGFTGTDGVAPASVVLFNTTTSPRRVVATVATSHGGHETRRFTIPALRPYTMAASSFSGRHYYGVSAVANGGGVTGTVTGVGENTGVISCASRGVTSWTTTGLSTHVDTTSVLTLLNPTATVAEVNVSTLSDAGFSAPQKFQGVVIASQGVAIINLGEEVVNERDVMAQVSVVQGSVVGAAAVSWTGNSIGATMVSGASTPLETSLFPNSPTNNEAVSTLALANPNDVAVTATVHVSYRQPASANASHAGVIYPFSLTLEPMSVMDLPISPSVRVPAGGARSLIVDGTGPLVATLVTSSSLQPGVWLSSPVTAAPTQMLLVNTIEGFGSVSVVNATSSVATVTLDEFNSQSPRVRQFSVAAYTTVFVKQHGHVHVGTYTSQLFSSTVPIAVAGSIAGQPNGVRVVTSSGGR
jgi:hypothetical protein